MRDLTRPQPQCPPGSDTSESPSEKRCYLKRGANWPVPRHPVSANEWEKMPSERVGVVQMEVGGTSLRFSASARPLSGA